MGFNAGDAIVNLRLNTDSVKKGLGSLKSSFGGLSGIVKGFALAGAAAFTVLTKQSFTFIDSLSKTSQKLGIATDKLVALQEAAKLTGVNTKTLNLGLQRMTRRIQEAAQGTGEAQGALKQLGLEAQALAAMSPDEQFLAIGDAMGSVASQGEKIRLGFKLFDSEAVGLINTLKLTRGEIEQIRQEAVEFGLDVGDENSKKVEKFNDAMTKAFSAVRGAFNRVAVEITPLMEFFPAILEGIKEWGKGLAEIVKFFVDMVTKIKPISEAIKLTFTVIGQWQNLLKSTFLNILAEIAEGINTVANSLTGLAGIEFNPIDETTIQGFRLAADEFSLEIAKSMNKGLAEGVKSVEIPKDIIDTTRAVASGGGASAGRAGGITSSIVEQANRFQQAALSGKDPKLEVQKKSLAALEQIAASTKTTSEMKAAVIV